MADFQLFRTSLLNDNLLSSTKDAENSEVVSECNGLFSDIMEAGVGPARCIVQNWMASNLSGCITSPLLVNHE
jgi:hypothetical protein